MNAGRGAGAQHEADAELAAAAGRGDQHAFNALMTAHRERLYVVCRRITCHHEDAQEALQNTMVLAWTRLRDFDGRSSVRTWLYRIATNAAIDEVRRRKRAPEPADSLPEQSSGDDGERTVASRVDIERALSKLPPQYRAVVVLRGMGELSYREIADLRDLPIDTVKSQLSRGRQALAELLADRAVTSA